MGVSNPRRFTSEFKRQAVALAEQLGSAPKAAQQLGVSESNIHNWKVKIRSGKPLRSHGDPSESEAKQSVPTESPEEELRRVRRENEQLKKANYILKQAAAFFSQDHLK